MKRVALATIIFLFMCLSYSILMAGEGKGESAYSKVLVSSKVLEALGKISAPQAKEVLIEGLKSKEFYIRAHSAEALGRLKDKDAATLLKGLVSDENYLVRIYATAALVELGDSSMEKPLLDFLNSNKPEIKANAVEKLGDFGNKYLPMIIEELSKDNSYLVRVKAIEQLGRNKFNSAISLVRNATKEENAQVRQVACFALGKIGDKEDEPLLETKLKDQDASVRAAAKEALSLLEEKHGALTEGPLIELIWQDVENKDPLLRASSYLALANLKDIKILPILLKEVINPQTESFLRLMSARALMSLKPHISDLVGKALTRSKTSILSLENLEFAYKVNGKDLLTIMIEALKNEKDHLHQDAPLILLELREKSSFPALREALFQDDPNIVASAAYALGELQDKDAVSDLIKVSKQYGF